MNNKKNQQIKVSHTLTTHQRAQLSKLRKINKKRATQKRREYEMLELIESLREIKNKYYTTNTCLEDIRNQTTTDIVRSRLQKIKTSFKENA